MDYASAVAWVLSFTNYERAPAPRAEAWDLRRVDELLSLLDNPHLGPVTLHVAGTKGKGSTCALLASALTSSGYRTGLYTSPHLHTIRERIAVDGTIATEEEFAAIAAAVRPAVDAVNAAAAHGILTTFEVLTAMAFFEFRRKGVQFQVIEVGLGGRLDATNVVKPAVCAITSISVDHTQFLGRTLREIAAEKAGIIKPGAAVVTAPQDPQALDVIETRCRQTGVPLTVLGRDIVWRREGQSQDGQDFKLWGKIGDRPVEHQLRTALRGPHQMENASLAMAVLERVRDLQYPVPHDTIYWGFSYVNWPGRLETVRESPLVILDGAHNTYSAMCLAEAVRTDLPSRPVYLVFGTSTDKDTEGMARELAPVVAGAFACASRHPRSTPPEKIADALWESGIKVRPESTVAAAVDKAMAEAGSNGIVLVTGSLFVVAEAREHLLGIPPELYPA